MQAFLRWAGGKRWLVPKILNKLPAHGRYFEPFVGSGVLFFALEPKSAVLSDTNPELINCYKAVRNHCNQVIAVLSRLQMNEETYYRVRDKSYYRADPIQRAAFFIYLNRTCWNGLYRVNKQGKFNVPVGQLDRLGKLFDPSELIIASHILKRAKIQCCDFEKAVENADPGDMVYFDPPYITTHLKNGFIKYNSRLFQQSDELRLATVAQRLVRAGVSVMVSNAAHPLIKQQYDGPFYKRELMRASLIAADPSKRSMFTELLITSFPLAS